MSQKSIDAINESVYELTFAIEFLADMWTEGGNSITRGWRPIVEDLRLKEPITKRCRQFLSDIGNEALGDNDMFVERAIILCIGAKIDTYKGDSLTKTRRYISGCLTQLFDIGAHLGMSEAESNQVIDGQMLMAREHYESGGDA